MGSVVVVAVVAQVLLLRLVVVVAAGAILCRCCLSLFSGQRYQSLLVLVVLVVLVGWYLSPEHLVRIHRSATSCGQVAGAVGYLVVVVMVQAVRVVQVYTLAAQGAMVEAPELSEQSEHSTQLPAAVEGVAGTQSRLNLGVLVARRVVVWPLRWLAEQQGRRAGRTVEQAGTA